MSTTPLRIVDAKSKLALQSEAQQRDAALQAGGPVVEWHEMRTYLKDRLAEAQAGRKSRTPRK